MSKIRIYLENQIIKDEKILMEKKTIHYLKNVMRRKNGDKIIMFNGDEEWEGIFKIERNCFLKPTKLIRKKKQISDIWVCFGLVKNRNIDILVEKVTEIGITKIVPIITDFSNKKNIRADRLKKISLEASEQSNSINIPFVEEVTEIKSLLKNWDKKRLICFCDEKGGKPILDIAPILKSYRKIAIFIGPVGGWSEADRKLFDSLQVFRAELGDNILKADTAAVYSLSCLKALLR
ncbi:MAG: RsmE family RNA methyltransferase [Alphaproteobacteria bacterium]